jgi:hypothetical protein
MERRGYAGCERGRPHAQDSRRGFSWTVLVTVVVGEETP